MYYVLRSTGNAYMMTSIIADCPDLASPPNILDKSTPMIFPLIIPDRSSSFAWSFFPVIENFVQVIQNTIQSAFPRR